MALIFFYSVLGWQGEELKLAYKYSDKQTLSKVLISPALKKGLRLQTNCKLTKIFFKKNEAIKAIAEINDGHSKKN